MQDSSFYSQIKAQVHQPQPQFPEHKHLKCPRCDSTNTKFCYYNNYNLSQPRHFCKSCRRYWTKGGALRNIPVGGGSRKNAKRSSASSSATSAAVNRPAAAAASVSQSDDSKKNSGEMAVGGKVGGQFGNFMQVSGSFSSLVGSSGGHFGNLIDGLGGNGSGLHLSGHFGDPGSAEGVDPQPQARLGSGSSINGDGFLNIRGGDDTGCWSGGGNDWPDLAIYTAGSNFQ